MPLNFVSLISLLLVFQTALGYVFMGPNVRQTSLRESNFRKTGLHSLRKRHVDYHYMCNDTERQSINGKINLIGGAVPEVIQTTMGRIDLLTNYLNQLTNRKNLVDQRERLLSDVPRITQLQDQIDQLKTQIDQLKTQIDQFEANPALRSTWFTYARLYDPGSRPKWNTDIHLRRLATLKSITEWILLLVTPMGPTETLENTQHRVQIICSDGWLHNVDSWGNPHPINPEGFKWDARAVQDGGPADDNDRQWVHWRFPERFDLSRVHSWHAQGNVNAKAGAVLNRMHGQYPCIIMLNPYMFPYWDNAPDGFQDLMSLLLPANGGRSNDTGMPLQTPVSQHLEAALIHMMSQCMATGYRNHWLWNVRSYADINPFGWNNVVRLAERNSPLAMRNADNYMYFAFALALDFSDWSTGRSIPIGQTPMLP